MLHCNEGWNRMAGGIVSIAQQKGGAGKTTLAVQLGVAWLSAGRRVAMLDIDPQASLFAWFNVRRRRFGEAENGLLVQGLSGWRLGSELRRLRREFDLIVVDSPPHAESDARGDPGGGSGPGAVPTECAGRLGVWSYARAGPGRAGPTRSWCSTACRRAAAPPSRCAPRSWRSAGPWPQPCSATGRRTPPRSGRPRRRRDGAEQRGRPGDRRARRRGARAARVTCPAPGPHGPRHEEGIDGLP